MPRVNWRYINERIASCRQRANSDVVISCLKGLFEETGDGMAAFSLAEELEKAGDPEGAGEYYGKAERLFPLPEFKKRAAQALERLSTIVVIPPVTGKRLEAAYSKTADIETSVDTNKYDFVSTLFIVSCTKKKIWDLSPSAPEYVPARYAYKGSSFLSFIQWVDEHQLERRGFKWMILSGKYGFIEPWHPISYYDIPIDDESYFPVTKDFLKNQVRQVRWCKNPDGRWAGYNLGQFSQIVSMNCGREYLNIIQMCFSNKLIEMLKI